MTPPNERARQLARDTPNAFHIIYSPTENHAYFCDGFDTYSRHRPEDPHYCPYVNDEEGRYRNYANYLVLTPAEINRPPVPTMHSHWRTA